MRSTFAWDMEKGLRYPEAVYRKTVPVDFPLHEFPSTNSPSWTLRHPAKSPLPKSSVIGIGAAVTRRPLPHHRAYGSVHGGSRRLR